MGRPKLDISRETTFNVRVTTEERELMRKVFAELKKKLSPPPASETDAFIHLYKKEAKRLKINAKDE